MTHFDSPGTLPAGSFSMFSRFSGQLHAASPRMACFFYLSAAPFFRWTARYPAAEAAVTSSVIPYVMIAVL